MQFIGGSALATFRTMAERGVEDFAGVVIENTIPFTHIERGFIGDRYCEYRRNIPRDADWSAQTMPRVNAERPDFFWWLRKSPLGDLRPHYKTALPEEGHTGLYDLDALQRLGHRIKAQSYLEIGTLDGELLRRISCEAVCVDPLFQLSAGGVKRTTPLHLYQTSSDEFFCTNALARIYPYGVDLAYIDGLHLFENVLRDFINTERNCHKSSVVLIHDALPVNSRMAERERRMGGDGEPARIHDWWTGDVWKLLYVLKRWRPDLRVEVLDCPPTGLVQVTNLYPGSTALSDREGEIIEWGSAYDRSTAWLSELWGLFPTVDTRRMFE